MKSKGICYADHIKMPSLIKIINPKAYIFNLLSSSVTIKILIQLEVKNTVAFTSIKKVNFI